MGHAARTPPEQLVDDYRQMAADDRRRELMLSIALHHQAARVSRKYQWVRIGQSLAAAGVLLGITAGVVAAGI